jgi:hypothetical protein
MFARVSACTITCGALLWGSAAPAQANAKQPTYETAFYRSGKLQIEAYVFKPEGAGPFPVVIYNHGARAVREREERPFAYMGGDAGAQRLCSGSAGASRLRQVG